jgi:hypothetical protein
MCIATGTCTQGLNLEKYYVRSWHSWGMHIGSQARIKSKVVFKPIFSNDMLKIHGEALDARYKATDRALIYALDHVDRFFGVTINDIYWNRYVFQFAGVPA